MDRIVHTKKMVFGGECIAEVGGKTVFVPFALPDEKLKISIVKEYKNYSKAVIREIISPSPERVKPKCKYFYKCGGCNLQMASDVYQHELRKNAALEALSRQGINADSQFVGGNDWEYRNRFQFHAGAGGKAGLKKNGSSGNVPIDDCPIGVPEIRRFLQNGMPVSLQKEERIQCFGTGGKVYAQGDICKVKIESKEIEFNTCGFFQSNIQMLEKLIRIIFSKSLYGKFLDLYSGVGTFSVFAAADASELHLVEHNKHSLDFAKKNISAVLQQLGKNTCVFYHKTSGEQWAQKTQAHSFDFAVVDPPRSGIEQKALQRLCSSGIRQIDYVSCDPVTFARDARVLISNGYSLDEHYLFDFYPQTHHIETLGIFKK